MTSAATQETAHRQAVTAFLASPRKHLIDGEWVASRSGKTFAVINPADESILAMVAEGDREDVEQATRAARAAFEDGPWPRMLPSERAKLLWRLADAIDANREELALLESLDNGKPVKVARTVDVGGAAEKFRYYAGWATKLTGDTVQPSIPGNWHAYSAREPVGVCALIVPWNFPLGMAANKLAPALAAGCTVVLKPAEQTPLSALRLGELMLEVGFPKGVVNIVTGYGRTAGAALVGDPRVDKISFTGSTVVGKEIIRKAADSLKRVTLELGGKSPTIVFPDADLDKAIQGASNSIFANTGQVCAAGSRLFAHRKVYDRLVEGIAGVAQKIVVGSGQDDATDIGPLVSQVQLERVSGYVAAGVGAGAEIVTGGRRIDRPGYFVQPTILSQTSGEMTVRREEIFGPVLCAMSFDDEDLAAIAAEANATDYGLSASIWTRDLSTAHKMARLVKSGIVRVNSISIDGSLPYGGFKQSGWGRENGREGIEAFTELKSVFVSL